MKEYWLKMAQIALYRANNSFRGLSCTYETSIKYYNPFASQAAKFYAIAAYCLNRYANS